MRLTTVRGQLTLEQTGVTFELGLENLKAMAQIAPREDEASHYYGVEVDLEIAVSKAEEDTSRAIYVAWPPVLRTKLHCLSFVQLLLGRGGDSCLIAAMRSSSVRRLRSDLGLLSRLALKYGCPRVVILIGSFHVELDPEELRPEELVAP